MGVFHVFKIVQMVPKGATHRIWTEYWSLKGQSYSHRKRIGINKDSVSGISAFEIIFSRYDFRFSVFETN